MYDMPSIQALQNSLPKKVHWKREVNEKINNFWTQKLVEEASSLKYLKITIQLSLKFCLAVIVYAVSIFYEIPLVVPCFLYLKEVFLVHKSVSE
jgi:hypothetical protein